MTTNPVGRPTIYKSEICDNLVELMASGLSKKEVASELGISRDTLYRWMKDHPEFGTAIKEGLDRSEAWHIGAIRMGMMGKIPRFNPTAAALLMNNVFNWSSKTKGDGDTNIHIGNMNVLNHLTTDELQDRINQKLEDLKIIDVNTASELQTQYLERQDAAQEAKEEITYEEKEDDS